MLHERSWIELPETSAFVKILMEVLETQPSPTTTDSAAATSTYIDAVPVQVTPPSPEWEIMETEGDSEWETVESPYASKFNGSAIGR